MIVMRIMIIIIIRRALGPEACEIPGDHGIFDTYSHDYKVLPGGVWPRTLYPQSPSSDP